MSSIDQQFVEFIVKSLVSKPDAVQIERRIDEKGVLLELTVDPEDLGRVIGKRGATAQSLRTLLRALGTKNDARYNLKIVDNGEPRERRSYEDAPRQEEHKQEQEGDETATETTKAEEIVEEKEQVAVASDPEVVEREDHDSIINKTRAELKEFDDLDV